jgi:hypothetical protein
MSWYIDLDEGNLEDEITLGPIRNVDCRRSHKPFAYAASGPRPNGQQSFKESKLLVRRRMANEIGVGANSNE